jgi:hypothetical protein
VLSGPEPKFESVSALRAPQAAANANSASSGRTNKILGRAKPSDMGAHIVTARPKPSNHFGVKMPGHKPIASRYNKTLRRPGATAFRQIS